MASFRDGRPALIVATIGTALVLFDGTVVTVALPSIQRDLKLNLSEQEWVIQAYLLAPIALLPVGGALADRLGRRAVFAAGMAVFAAASALCAVAGDPMTLVAGRALQGVGAGLTLPASLGLLTAAAAHRAERRRSVALWTVWTAAAGAAGPVLGGAIAGYLGWRWIFGLSLVLASVTVAVTRRFVWESRDPGARRPGWQGPVLLVVAVGALGLTLGRVDAVNWRDPALLVPAATGLLAGGLFVALERRAKDPLVPPIMFTHPSFNVANLLTASVYGALFGALFLISLFLQQTNRVAPVDAGLALLPFALGLVLASPLGERVAEGRGPRLPVAAGCAVAGAALAAIAIGNPGIAGIVVAAGLAGTGLGAAAGPLMAAVVDSVELRRAGVAGGVNAAVSRIAAIGAIAVLGLLASLAFERALEGEAVGAPARERAADRVFAAPRLLERTGFPAGDVEGARDAATTGFRVAIGAAGCILLASALLAAVGLGTPLEETGEMPLAVMPSPLAVALRRRMQAPARRDAHAVRKSRGPPATGRRSGR